jgi:predicted tellurium resistance membrane protein TerC
MEILYSPDAWIALLTLTFLEIVLGIDNIILAQYSWEITRGKT